MIVGTLSTVDRPLLIAEIGNNHEGSLARAQELVRRAAEAGVDAVKFQTYRTRLFGNLRDRVRYERLERFELSFSDFEQLHRHAKDLGLLFISTPLDLESAAFLGPLVDAYKIASGDITFYPLIERVCETGKPIILSSGASEEAFRQSFAIDLMHTRNLAEAALPHLALSGMGSFCAISSVSGSEDYGYGGVSYGTMKAALFFYVKSFARHAAAKGVRANIVSPGTTYFEGGYWHEVEVKEPERFARNIADNPLGRMATPEEIANAVVFLASTKASFISGVNLTVDGTLTVRIPN